MPAAPVTEAFRALRSTIRFMSGEKPIKTLVATSTKAAEGKSTVVANLAASMAQAGLTVTAVDADLRRPRLASFFGAPATNGLTDVLAGILPAAKARQATRIPGLYVVPAGNTSANAGELLDNGRIGKALEDLREDNDMVIVDTPPVGVVTDAALVGSAADATILVIESGTVEPEDARAALSKLTQTARARVLGVVLVGGEAPISKDYVRYVSASANGNGNGYPDEAGGRKAQARTKV
jgi:capsular exopolysaccharide synthesis family protein